MSFRNPEPFSGEMYCQPSGYLNKEMCPCCGRRVARHWGLQHFYKHKCSHGNDCPTSDKAKIRALVTPENARTLDAPLHIKPTCKFCRNIHKAMARKGIKRA